jgi:hypothetical protein
MATFPTAPRVHSLKPPGHQGIQTKIDRITV